MPMPTPTHLGISDIARRIVFQLSAPASQASVSQVTIGLGYTAVGLTDGRLGVAYTFRDEARGGCTVLDRSQPLAGKPASELLDLLASTDRIEAGVGLACANALGNRPHEGLQRGDILDQLDVRPDDHVGMVGLFRPLVPRLEERAGRLTVFERVAQPTDRLRPTTEAPDVLPTCQVALITSTSIINHTVDDLLRAAAGCRKVVMLGASTPLLPEVFEATPVAQLSGVIVRQPQDVVRVLSEAGGMKLFSPYVDKVSLAVRGTGPRPVDEEVA